MPQAAANQQPSGPLAWLIYPKSRVILQIANDDGSRLLQLICFDGIDDVIGWYIARFSPSKRIGLPDGGAILKGSVTTALILPSEQHVTVTVKRSGLRFEAGRR
jgi:hypothetical protein